MSEEQRAAIRLGCAEHQLVLIEGHAGTGKSTTLTGIARAHQACGREIIVTSTAALAADRLAGELTERDVSCTAYSTAGLHAAITTGRVQLTSETTVIHDEAALASTREQLQLLRAVEASGARLIAVGDPRQNQPVGAGGLWSEIEHATRDGDAHVELTVNQRARDLADRRDQARFRDGQAELALRGYAARDRVHLHRDQERVEDRALDAADTNRRNGLTTIVIAQTSNEQLDALNARAQAIRRQHTELGEEGVEVPGRPYQLHAGDHVQVRHTINHPDHGQLRNGTSAHVVEVDPRSGELDLQLADGTRLHLDERQVVEADLRLAYVQHPFPAQGHTTDTAHVIVAGHATREGTYVALTRARDQTHIYAADVADAGPDVDRLQALAERISHSEPELPSISTPLAHEAVVTASAELARADRRRWRAGPELVAAQVPEMPPRALARETDTPAIAQPSEGPQRHERSDSEELAVEHLDLVRGHVADPDRARTHDRDEESHEAPARRWPRQPGREPVSPQHLLDRVERDQTLGWEP